MIAATTEINLSRVLREDVKSADDLARLALEALDQCAYRLYDAGKHAEAKILNDARSELTTKIRAAFHNEE